MSTKLPALLLAVGALSVSCAMRGDTRAGRTTEAVIYAVGDVAECLNKPPAQTPTASTAALLRQTSGPILLLGDIAYPKGSHKDFQTCFDPIWGDLKARILPAPGNHEYVTDSAQPYFAYFGAASGTQGKGYYSMRIGAWRIFALNSNIDAKTGSEQERWLRTELAADKTKCALAFWHHPLFTSALHGNDPRMRDIWRTLHQAGVDVVLNGHDHVYERFAPQTPDGMPDASRGIREFIVGTGGARLYQFVTIQPNSEMRQNGVWGVLELRLRDDNYAWKFIPVAGPEFLESGTDECHD